MNNEDSQIVYTHYAAHLNKLIALASEREIVLQGYFRRNNGAFIKSDQPHRFHFFPYKGYPKDLLKVLFNRNFWTVCVNASLERVNTRKLSGMKYEDARIELRENIEDYIVPNSHNICFDFDSPDLGRAAMDTTLVYQDIMNCYPEWQPKIYFSGKKGFHIHTSAEVPRETAKEVYRSYNLLAKTVDTGMSDPMRYVKLPNTIHPSTGNVLEQCNPLNYTPKRIIEVKI